MAQREENQRDASSRDDDFTKGKNAFGDAYPKHVGSRSAHQLLVLKIALCVGFLFGLLPIGWNLLLHAIKRCSDCVDIVLDGNRKGWRGVALWLGCELLGAMIAGYALYGSVGVWFLR
jgi:hypothetical protein